VSFPSSFSGKPLAAQTGEPSGAESDGSAILIVEKERRDRFALARADGSPGLAALAGG